MRMRFRVLIALLFLSIPGIFVLKIGSVSAQTNGALQRVRLSSSGYEEAYSLAYSGDGKYFAVGGLSGIYLFDAQKLSSLDYLDTQALARNVLFLPDSHTLAAALFDDTIKLWNVPNHQLTNTLSGPQGWVRGISVSKDGSLLASASDDNTVRIWKMPSGELLLTIDQNTQGIRAVAISPDGKLVAGALEDHTVRVWRVADGSLLYTLVGHTDWVRCLAFSPDGSLLASGSFDMTVRLWRMSDGSLERTLKGHSSSILKLAFSPDGNILASSAVDETVRLWHVSDGNLISTLKGYTGFIYALSFSPDGKTLASGGGDNELLIWNLDALGIDSATAVGQPAAQTDVQSTTSDCRECHHPRGQGEPPRVIYLQCDACHANGANLEWCPAFQRASDAGPTVTGYTPPQSPSGLPISGGDITVLIASPSNGETLYARNGITAPAFVAGQVFSGNTLPTTLQVKLDVWSGNQKTASLTTTPSPTGSYKFNLAINPQGALPYMIKPGGSDCLPCHEDYRTQAPIPSGEVRLVVSVVDSTGHQASDERWVRVDSSGAATVPVQVLDSLTNKPLPGLSVSASTILYGWRGRYGAAVSNSNGTTQLNLEALSQATTHYHVSVPPQVVNGVLYASQPTQLDLTPGTTTHDAVTLTASAQNGQINGNVENNDSSVSLAGLHVRAIQLPAGPVYETTLSSQNTFVFDPIPISQYVIAPDPSSLIIQGLSMPAQTVDLIDAPAGNVVLNELKSQSLSGKVSDKDGNTIAFAFLQVNNKGATQVIDPTSGQFLITDLPKDASFVTVIAPGYYSQSQHIPANQNTLNVQLVPESETKNIPWGTGQIVIPPESDATVNGLDISLNNGWVWGKSNTLQTVTVHISGASINISSGAFALEDVAGQTGWLYLYQGQAQIQFNSEQTPVQVGSGEMVALLESAKPMPLDESVALALHPALSEFPIAETLQPTLGARVSNWLATVGIGAAQTITFITYILSLVALFAIPLFVLFWIKKRRNKSMDSQE